MAPVVGSWEDPVTHTHPDMSWVRPHPGRRQPCSQVPAVDYCRVLDDGFLPCPESTCPLGQTDICLVAFGLEAKPTGSIDSLPCSGLAQTMT